MQNFIAVDETPLLILIIVIIVFAITAISFLEIGREAGYREGQLDALNGEQMFEMQVQTDTLYIQKPQ